MKNKPWIIDEYYNFIIDDDITLGNYLELKILQIKDKIKTTQNNYGDYMQLLIKCGGNINGINDAMRVING